MTLLSLRGPDNLKRLSILNYLWIAILRCSMPIYHDPYHDNIACLGYQRLKNTVQNGRSQLDKLLGISLEAIS